MFGWNFQTASEKAPRISASHIHRADFAERLRPLLQYRRVSARASDQVEPQAHILQHALAAKGRRVRPPQRE